MPKDPTTPDDARTGREIVLDCLREHDGTPVPTTEVRRALRRAKPAASHSLADVTLTALRRAGLAERGPTGWTLTAQGRDVLHVDDAHRADASPPQAAPADVAVPPRAAVGDTLTIRLSVPMRARLEELVAEGFCGFTAEEVAERYLSRALRAFSGAN